VIRHVRSCLALCVGASLFLPTVASAAFGPERGVYGGKATGGDVANRVHPISASLSKDGKRIKLLRVTAPATCTPSGSLNTSPAWEDVKLARNGSFSDSDKFNQRGSDGSVTTWRSNIQGSLTGKGGSGKARDRATVRDAGGNVIRSCDSGVVRFDLERGAGVFGGSVNLGAGFPAFGVRYPVSVERDRRGTKLTSFRIRYIAKCGPSSHHTNSFVHSNIQLDQRGDFSLSRKFSYRSTTTDNTYSGTVNLRGHLGDSRGSGTYRAKFNVVLANGDKIPCETRKRNWSVLQR
jgi:hypothetical protein